MFVLSLIFLLQIFALLGTNLFFLENLLGYDASAVYLQALEISKQQTLLIDNWIYTSTLTWDTPMLLAVPLYNLFGDLFFAFGLSISFSVFLFLWVGHGLLKQVSATARGKLLFFVFLLSPFVTYADAFNRIDYFGVMLSIFGVYSLKIAMIMGFWYLFFQLDRGLEEREHILFTQDNGDDFFLVTADRLSWKLGGYVLLALFCAWFSAISSGFYLLLYGILPPLCYGIFRNCLRDRWDKYNLQSLGFLLLSVGLSLWGKQLQTLVLGKTGHDSNMGWTTIEGFWENLASIFQGYLQLTGALPMKDSPSLFSSEGIFFVFFLVISLGLFVTGLMKMCHHVKTKKDTVMDYYTFVFGLIFLIFVFVYTTYGAPIFEIRYLIPNFVLLVLFASLWLAEQLDGKNKSWRSLLEAVVLPSLIVVNCVSYYYIYESKNARALTDEVISYLAEHESPVVHVMGVDCIVFGQNIRVFDTEKTYIWSKTGEEFTFSGDYTYYLENADYDGPVPLVISQQDFETLPDYYQGMFQKTHDFSSFVSLYECDRNPIDYVNGIDPEKITLDFPYTKGVTVSEEGRFLEDGRYRVSGNDLFVLEGSGDSAPSGNYDLTLYYTVVSARNPDYIGTFSLSSGEDLISSARLSATKGSVTLKNVNLDDYAQQSYDYRLSVTTGTMLDVFSIEFRPVG